MTMMDQHPKLCYKVKEIAGDYYFEKMSKEETMQKAFYKPASKEKYLKSQTEIGEYVRDNMNKKFPLDGPLWSLYVQDKFEPTDQNDLPEDMKSHGFIIFRAHHSLCDGISIMCMTLAMGAEYNRDYFIKSKDAKWWEILFVKLTCIL
jgi:hypothetical protein